MTASHTVTYVVSDTSAPMHPLALTIQAAADAVGLSASYIRTQVRAGELPVRKAGDKPLVVVADLEKWLLSRPYGDIR